MRLSFLNRIEKGFTLVEVTIAMSISTLCGGMIFLVLTAGMNLYGKNTAVNAAHQQARSGVDQLLQNVHSAISIPQLVNIDTTVSPPVFKAIAGSGPASGISFQRFEAGPFPVVVDAAATATSLVLKSDPFVPSATTRLNIPSHNIELDVVSSSSAGGKRTYNFAAPIGTAVNIDGTGEDGGATYVIPAFLTFRVSYAVVRSGAPAPAPFIGELRYYATNDVSSYRVIARNVTSDTPFKVPAQAIKDENGALIDGYLYGGPQNKYVAAVNISTVEPQFSNRGYAAVNMFISSLIPFRCRMTTSQ